MLVATAHGESLLDLVDNYALNSILGGLETVTLGDKERKERGIEVKTVRECKARPAFDVAIELQGRTRWVIIHTDVRVAVDSLLRGAKTQVIIRSWNPQDGVISSTEGWADATG